MHGGRIQKETQRCVLGLELTSTKKPRDIDNPITMSTRPPGPGSNPIFLEKWQIPGPVQVIGQVGLEHVEVLESKDVLRRRPRRHWCQL